MDNYNILDKFKEKNKFKMKIKLEEIKENKENPRKISEVKLNELINSILSFPEMLEVRPIVLNNENVALGGNMRTKALTAIAEYDFLTLRDKISNIKTVPTEKIDELTDYWDEWQKNKEVPAERVENLTAQQERQFIIADNVGFGEWDKQKLDAWDKKELRSWGLSDWEVKETKRIKGENSFKEEFNKIDDKNCELPIVPEFFEHYECFLIPVHNTIDEGFVRDLFDLNKNYKSDSGDGKVRKTNVISIDNLRKLVK